MSLLARRYARALFEVAESKGVTDTVAQDVEQVHAAVSDELVARTVRGPELSAALRARLVDKLGDGRHELVRNLLATLSRRRRLALLPEIGPAFAALRREARNEAVGVVETARPLGDGQLQALEALAGNLSGRKVALTVRENPELLGGVRMSVGNTLYDGSAVGRLRQLRERMLASRLG